VRTCPVCGTANRSENGFCIGCATPLPAEARPVSWMASSQTQFSLPDYLRQDAERQRRRKLAAEGAGSGLIWTGFPLAAGALFWSSGSTLGNLLIATGLLLIVGGFWRMRHDRRAFARAGLGTAVVGAIALGVVLAQLFDAPLLGERAGGPRLAAPLPTAHPDWLSPPAQEGPAASVAMLGGGPDHTGEQAGPGPIGKPHLRWRSDIGGELYSSPAVVDGTVFLGTKSGFLAALDVRSGDERWRADLGGYIVRASPAVADGTVYVGAGYALFALDATTGREEWRLSTRFAGSSSPVVAQGVVYAATQEGHVYAVDARTGEERWHVQAEGLIFASPAVSDNRVFAGTDDGHLYAIAADTGRRLWDFAVGGEIYASASVVDSTVYVSSTARKLHAIDVSTGEERWQAEVGGDASPAVVNGVVFVGGTDGGLHALDAATGHARWLFPTGHPIEVGPAVVDDTIYVGSGPTLYAVDIARGSSRWAYPIDDTISAAPAVLNGTIYIGSHDGFLYAIDGGTSAANATG